MKTDSIINGWYSDLSLQGDKVSLIRDSHIVLNGEAILLPGENVLYLTMKNVNGVIYLSGQGHITGDCLLWDSVTKVWRGIGSTFGFNPCAFSDIAANLFVVTGNNVYGIYDLLSKNWSPLQSMQIGSQGFRYVKQGIPITGDSTYGPGPYDLAQYVELQSGLAIGQSYIDGCVASYGQRYKILSGDAQFIRAYIQGNNIVFCIVVPGINAYFYWMTLDELRTFPLESYDPPTHPPDPPVDPPVNPPVDPPTEPIKPKPEPVIKLIKELQLMEPEIVSLVAFDHYARLVNGVIVFDQTTESAATDFEISKPDNRFAIKPVADMSKFLGMDATTYGDNVCKQVTLSNERGNYESWFIGVRPSGMIEAVVEYIDQGVNNTVPFSSAVITIKRKK